MTKRIIEPWIQTYTGRRYYPLNPQVEDVHIDDIARALSHQCRFNGHTKMFYSVAQHCVLVSQNVTEEYAPWGLLHDAAEAYVCDMPRPLKHTLEFGKLYDEIEQKNMKAIADHFGLELPIPDIVREVDHRLLFDEREIVLNEMRDGIEWSWQLPRLGITFQPLSCDAAYHQFMDRFYEVSYFYIR